MKTKLTIENVVTYEKVVITTYPMWSDYGCLTNAIKVVTLKDGEYVEATYVTEEIQEGNEAYELSLVMLDRKFYDDYLKRLKGCRILKSQLEQHSIFAKPGDRVVCVKGKYRGVTIVIDHEYNFTDHYGRVQASYWVSKDYKKVNKDTSVIVGDKPDNIHYVVICPRPVENTSYGVGKVDCLAHEAESEIEGKIIAELLHGEFATLHMEDKIDYNYYEAIKRNLTIAHKE